MCLKTALVLIRAVFFFPAAHIQSFLMNSPTRDPFQSILGHDAVKRLLRSGLMKPPHGYLFVGPDGSGAHVLAEAFIRQLLNLPADKSLVSHPDCAVLLREPSPSGGLKKEISVEAVRMLRDRMSRSSGFGGYQVAYVPEADALNIEGVNALLKSIEEPKAKIVYVFISHQESRLPATLRSRLVRLPLRRVPDNVIRSWLISQTQADTDAVERAIAYAMGRPGAARRYLEDADLALRVEAATKTVKALIDARSFGDACTAIREEAENADGSDDPVALWRETIQLWEGALRDYWISHPYRAVHLAHVMIRAEKHAGGPVSPRIWLELGLTRVVRDRPIPFPTLLPAPFPYPND